MKTPIKDTGLHSILIFATLSLVAMHSAGQGHESILSERIAVIARPSADSITLRWAPLASYVWRWANTYGYRIERYTLARSGRLLPRVEKTVLTTAVAPKSESDWERLVTTDKYAAIAAQALYGDRFEVDLHQSDIFTIVNKVRENEQRFAFALFCADMAPEVARASGLWFTDRNVTQDEKYLYRIVINSMDSLRGSIFVGPRDPYILPKPQNLKGDFRNGTASLRWDKAISRTFTAYIVERSEDGKNFRMITESPVATVSPSETEETRYEYAIDSVQDLSKTYYYRVKGVTPFGEESPPSAITSGKALPPVSQVPYITTIVNIRNTSLLIEWKFPAADNLNISGFSLESASEPRGLFRSVTEQLLPPETRQFQDSFPQQTNYYRVTAHGLDNAVYPSPVYFAQLVDSLPPTVPATLQGRISEDGNVNLSWRSNPEPDIFGYRVYRSSHLSEEMSLLTGAPIETSTFTDQLDLNTLNERVYYRVMALDVNQNHSGLSEPLAITLPDKVKPQPPVFRPAKSKLEGVSLQWIRSSSTDVVRYNLYRKEPDKPGWELIRTLPADSDTLYNCIDDNARPGQINHYTVVAIDDAGLESTPASPVSGGAIDQSLRPAVRWKKPKVSIELNQLTISWEYGHSKVAYFKVYRSVGDRPPVLFRSVEGHLRQFTHELIPGEYYRYRIMALFTDGRKSALSDEMKYQF